MAPKLSTMRYLILMALFGLVLSVDSFDGARRRLRSDVLYNERNHKQGQYKYGYAVKQGETQFHHQRSRDGAMYGCYGYVDPRGKLSITHYLADMAGYRLVNLVNPDRTLIERLKNLGTADDPIELQNLFPKECSTDGDIRMLQDSAKQMKVSSPADYQFSDSSPRSPSKQNMRSTLKLVNEENNSIEEKVVLSEAPETITRSKLENQSQAMNSSDDEAQLLDSSRERNSSLNELTEESKIDFEQSRHFIRSDDLIVEQQDEIDQSRKTNEVDLVSEGYETITGKEYVGNMESVSKNNEERLQQINYELLEQTTRMSMDVAVQDSRTSGSVEIGNTELVYGKSESDLITLTEPSPVFVYTNQNQPQPIDTVEHGNTETNAYRIDLIAGTEYTFEEDVSSDYSSEEITSESGNTKLKPLSTESSHLEQVRSGILDDKCIQLNHADIENLVLATKLPPADLMTHVPLSGNKNEITTSPGLGDSTVEEDSWRINQEGSLNASPVNNSAIDQIEAINSYSELPSYFISKNNEELDNSIFSKQILPKADSLSEKEFIESMVDHNQTVPDAYSEESVELNKNGSVVSIQIPRSDLPKSAINATSSRVFRGNIKFADSTSTTTEKSGKSRTFYRNRGLYKIFSLKQSPVTHAVKEDFSADPNYENIMNYSTEDSVIGIDSSQRYEHPLSTEVAPNASVVNISEDSTISSFIEQPALEYAFNSQVRFDRNPETNSKITTVNNFGSSYIQPIDNQNELDKSSANLNPQDSLSGVDHKPYQVHNTFVELRKKKLTPGDYREGTIAGLSQSRIGPLPEFQNPLDDIDSDEAIGGKWKELHRYVDPKLPATPRTTFDDIPGGLTLPYAFFSHVTSPRPTKNYRPFTPVYHFQPTHSKSSGTLMGSVGDVYDEIEDEIDNQTVSTSKTFTPPSVTQPSITNSTTVTEPFSYCYEIMLHVPVDARQIIIKTDSSTFRVLGQGDPKERINLLEPGVYEVNVGATSAIRFHQYQRRPNSSSRSNKVSLDLGKNFDYSELIPKPLYDRRSYQQQQQNKATARVAQNGLHNPYLPVMDVAMTKVPVLGRSVEERKKLPALTTDQIALLNLVPSWKKVLLHY
ncbi:uncharacterized protein LOC131436454 [Malaya genurostris]|uniref:uncharacterized protein LOC131436454 n=1 Tax=Malaya genurostris TaxID=325434 RepID=UPI0026F3F2B5|nr:uncharacterized protein LOC131436454 [Malaya genurostris]